MRLSILCEQFKGLVRPNLFAPFCQPIYLLHTLGELLKFFKTCCLAYSVHFQSSEHLLSFEWSVCMGNKTKNTRPTYSSYHWLLGLLNSEVSVNSIGCIIAHNSDFPYVKCNYIWHIVMWYVQSNGKRWL